jgi:hypothetical protein
MKSFLIIRGANGFQLVYHHVNNISNGVSGITGWLATKTEEGPAVDY